MAAEGTVFSDHLSEKIKNVNVLILGDYKPDVCLCQLKNLKEYLIGEGLHNTHLTLDFPNNEEVPKQTRAAYNFTKSVWYIEQWAHVLLFIFSSEGNNKSVIREWGIMMACKDKRNNSVALLSENEETLEKLEIGITGGEIQMHNLSFDTFTNETKLHENALKACTNKIYANFF